MNSALVPVDPDIQMKQSRLIYTSIATAEVVSNETLRDLSGKAAAANAEHKITGLLILSGNRFLQVLEGPQRMINTLYRNIIRDARHHDVELITYEPISSRYFDDWTMRLVDLYDLPRQPRDYLAAKYRHKDGIIQIPDRLHEVYALLLDAKVLCLSHPWTTEDAPEQAPHKKTATAD